MVGLVVGMLVTGVSLATLNPGQGDNSQCCYSKSCPDGNGGFNTATSCIQGCASNQVCSGDGGCEPTVWAQAQCKPKPN